MCITNSIQHISAQLVTSRTRPIAQPLSDLTSLHRGLHSPTLPESTIASRTVYTSLHTRSFNTSPTRPNHPPGPHPNHPPPSLSSPPQQTAINTLSSPTKPQILQLASINPSFSTFATAHRCLGKAYIHTYIHTYIRTRMDSIDRALDTPQYAFAFLEQHTQFLYGMGKEG